MLYKFKGSAIHNLVITGQDMTSPIEGLLLGKDLIELADLDVGQEIIITRIGASSWGNRIKTIVYESSNNGDAIICGSLIHFLKPGELTCLIGEVYLEENDLADFEKDMFPIFDVGFNPHSNCDNLEGTLDLQYKSRKDKNVDINIQELTDAKVRRSNLLKSYMQSLIVGMKVNKTHPDCLQGSAELPGVIVHSAGLQQYNSVTVYNASVGGSADTYVVPMPDGIVMTTGAMASFAQVGESVNVASFLLSKERPMQHTVVTDGTNIHEIL